MARGSKRRGAEGAVMEEVMTVKVKVRRGAMLKTGPSVF
jgi:hypothetical protein